MPPLVENVQQIFEQMPAHFVAEKAGSINAVIQMDLAGEQGGQWQLLIADGALQVQSGSHPSPNMTMELAAADWLKVVNGEANAMALFMGGKIKVKGDMSLAMKMQNFFKF
ncbi:MAG: hypothetical protein DWI63_01135 [Chloroflexi bacterium]|nr:MAG: hypothetical protein DWI63_01135 [Chloroflexota bacterium]RLT52269.1 MAG: hypothetical protein DWI68_02540 [Chloroflexota bacterium]